MEVLTCRSLGIYIRRLYVFVIIRERLFNVFSKKLSVDLIKQERLCVVDKLKIIFILLFFLAM